MVKHNDDAKGGRRRADDPSFRSRSPVGKKVNRKVDNADSNKKSNSGKKSNPAPKPKSGKSSNAGPSAAPATHGGPKQAAGSAGNTGRRPLTGDTRRRWATFCRRVPKPWARRRSCRPSPRSKNRQSPARGPLATLLRPGGPKPRVESVKRPRPLPKGRQTGHFT